MNEEALQVLYGLAQGDGYTKSYEDFKVLMGGNSDAVQQMYTLARADGYTKNKSDFDVLVGYAPTSAEPEVLEDPLKKKEDTVSVSEDGSLESQKPTDFLDFTQMASSPMLQELQREETMQQQERGVGSTLRPDFAESQKGNRFVSIFIPQEDGSEIEEQIDLMHPDGRQRRINIDKYLNFKKGEGLTKSRELAEQQAKSATASKQVVARDPLTGRPLFDIGDIALIKPIEEKEIKKEYKEEQERVSKLKRYTDEDKKRYESYNVAANVSLSPLPQEKQKDYLPTNVTTIPKAAEVIEGKAIAVVPFSQEMYAKDKELYAMLYDQEVEDYKDFLKDKSGYIRTEGKYYNPKYFTPSEVFNNKVNNIINSDLIDKEEGYVVKKLQDELSPFGFSFESSGTFTDNIVVTSPDGTSKEFSLDNFYGSPSAIFGSLISNDYSESTKLKAFLKSNYTPEDSKEQTADLLRRLKSSERRALDREKERIVKTTSQELYESEKKFESLDAQLKEIEKKIVEEEKEPDEITEWRGNVETSIPNSQKFDNLQFLNNKKDALEKNISTTKDAIEAFEKDKGLIPAYVETFAPLLNQRIESETEVLNKEISRTAYLESLYREKEKVFLEAQSQAVNLAEKNFNIEEGWTDEEAMMQYGNIVSEIISDSETLDRYATSLSMDKTEQEIKAYEIRHNVGRKQLIDAELGEFGDSLVSAFISGTGSVIEGGSEEFAGTIIRNINNMFYDESDEEYITDAEMNEMKKKDSVKKDMVTAFNNWADLTPEAMQAFRESLGVASKGFYGALESTPAMLLSLLPGGRVLAPMGFSFLSAQALREQMDKNPDFDYMSENDKIKFLAPMAFLIGLLENYGFRNVIKNSSFMGSAAKKLAGKGPSVKTLNELSDDLFKGQYKRELGKLASSGLGEMETEAMQEALDIYGKEYMDLKTKNNFWDQDVRFFKDEKGDVNYFSKKATGQIIEASLAGFFGGISMKAPSSIASAVSGNKIEEIDDTVFKFYEAGMKSPEVMNAQRAQIKKDVADGKMTQEQATEQWNVYTRTVGQMREVEKVASEYDSSTKKKLLSLLMEKKFLEEKIDGVDKSLTKEDQRKIKVADERIQEALEAGETKLNEDRQAYETAKKDGYQGTFKQHREGKVIDKVINEAVEKAAKEKKAPITEEVVEETAVTEEAPLAEEQPTVPQEALETQPITKITTELVAKEKKGELTQEETDGVLLGIMEKVEAENAKRKSPLSPEQAQKKLGKMQQRVFEGNKQRYLELSGVMPAAQEQVVEEAIKKETKEKPRFEDSKVPVGRKIFTITDPVEGTTTTHRYKIYLDGSIGQFETLKNGKFEDDTSFGKRTYEQIKEVFEKEGDVVEITQEEDYKSVMNPKMFDKLTTDQQQRVDSERAKTKTKEAPKRKTRKKKAPVKEAPVVEQVTEEVTQPIAKPKVIISGTSDGYQVVSSSNTTKSENESIKDARGDKSFGKDGFRITKRKDGSSEVSYRSNVKLTDQGNRPGYAMATVIIPEGSPVNKQGIQEAFDNELSQIIESNLKKKKAAKLTNLTSKQSQQLTDAVVKSLSQEQVTEKEAVKEAPKKTTKKKPPVKKEAKISEQVQKEIDRAERLKGKIVADKRNEKQRLRNSNLTREQRIERREELEAEERQTEKRYNNIITELKEGKRTQFQLEAETTSEQTKEKLLEIAENLVEDVTQENDGDISESPWTAEQPAPGADIITIEVKENSELAKKVRKMGLDELVGKKISLVMADQLKVDEKRMGGPFFPLMDKLFGKVAWASINESAASGIINGAIKSDYSVVYNMSPSAIDSNSIMGETLVELLEGLPKSQRQEVFELMKENVTKSKAKDFVRIKEVFEKSSTLPQALNGLKELGVDERAALLKKVVPSRDVVANTPIGIKLQENNITIEGLRELNIEQFVSELPAGAMTMVLEVTDKAGNKITKETKDEALITPEQQREEGLPEHPNYPVYIRGKAVGILTETTPFYNMLKDVARNIEVKIAGIVKKKDGRKITSKEARSNEMRAASMAASRARTTQAPQASRYQQFVSVLRRSFPSVEVVTTQSEFDTLLKETGAKQLTTKNQKVYGAVYQGKLYLNPSLENYNTPIHEFGHVWMNVAKEANPELYKKGLSLVKGSKYEQDVLNNKAYQKVIKQMRKDGASEQEINNYIQEEALATAIGDKGESFVSASQKKSFKDWLSTLYGFVRKLTGISKYTSKQLEDITLDEFTQAVAVDLLSGRQLFEGAEITDMGDALQLMAEKGVDLDAAMSEAINDMIDKGFKAAEIKGVLLQMGYKARAINDALVVAIDADMKLPNDFANIDGGVREGEALFRSVMQKLKEFAAPKLVKRSIKEQYNEAKKDGYKGTLKEYTEEQNIKKVEMLKQANPLLTLLTNEEILERYPNIQNQVIDKRQKSRAEIRAKAIELLRAEAAFQAQDNLTQLRLIESMDRTMKTRSNKSVQKKINAIKQTLKGVREGVKDLQAAKKRIKNFINEELLSIGVTTSDAKKLVRIVEKATKETYESSVKKVMQVVEKQTEAKRKSLLQEMLKLAKQKATVKNKRARTSPEAASFFRQAVVVIEALKKGDTKTLESLEEDLKKEEENINEILDRVNNGEKITTEEQDLVSLAQAFDILGSLNKQDISEVQDALNLMKSELESGMESLRTRRAARKVVYDRLRAEAEAQIKEGYEFLFNKNGKPLSDTELNLLRGKAKQEMWNNITNIKKLKDAVTTFYRIESQTKGKFSLFSNSLKNLGTLLRGLDRKGNFFEKNVFDRLNNMEESYLQGYFNTMDLLESELNAIGIEGGIDGLTRVINDGIVTNEVKEIKGILVSMQEGSIEEDIKFTKDMAMRVYALSKNADQMKRLKNQGFTPAKMQQIERFLGPQLIDATDLIVNYLSTSYYESINEVYENVNDVSLPFIENYFPTRTVLNKSTQQAELDKLTKDMSSGNFSGTLSAQTASALKERSSKDGAIDLSTSQDFTSVLEEHFRTMERFKAYAMGTKEINIIMNHTPSVKSLLDATRLGGVINNRIMYAINPEAAQQVFELQNPNFSWFQRQFVGVTLALKLIQLPKQATSFMNAFADYKYRKNNRIPGLDRVLDLTAFLGEVGYNLFSKSAYKNAMQSASFRNRIRESFKTADLLGLEQGTGARVRTKKTKLRRALRKAKVVANSPTLIGDIMGVMGYMAAYNANIRNGMSQEEAIEKFNAYNETQQTRRPTDKIGIQISQSPYTRAFTMFGSTLFLQLNKVIQSYTNIRRGGVDAISSAVKGDMKGVKENFPKAKDTRELYLNLAVANLLFVAMSNVFKYNPFADDDEDEQLALDRAEVMKALKEASVGMNILYNLPLVGPTVQQTVDYFYWENPNAFSKSKQRYVNPIEQLFRGAYWEMTLDDMSATEAFSKSILSLVMGVNVDKPLALYDRARIWFGDDDIFRKGYEKKNEKGEREFEGTYEQYKQKMLEENFYELFGISYSYRPGSGKDWTKKKITITIEPKAEKKSSSGRRKRRTRKQKKKKK